MNITQLSRTSLIDGLTLIENTHDLSRYGTLIHLLKSELDKRAVISFELSKENIISFNKLFDCNEDFMISVEGSFIEKGVEFIKQNYSVSGVTINSDIDKKRYTSFIKITSHSITAEIINPFGLIALYDLTSLFSL
ncbi:hypothetical protein [Rosenbergiella collisarenosi]|uniref:hypothetical protein n=1 Tax=Rosenbergiella collisarenosi TaxID=1544695 RepID=UPI001F4D8E13|nr:hypothetical protein [Rosenbergiella collisarenosi]